MNNPVYEVEFKEVTLEPWKIHKVFTSVLESLVEDEKGRDWTLFYSDISKKNLTRGAALGPNLEFVASFTCKNGTLVFKFTDQEKDEVLSKLADEFAEYLERETGLKATYVGVKRDRPGWLQKKLRAFLYWFMQRNVSKGA